jgi:hypothetical protein
MPATGVIYVPGNPRGLSEAEEECRLNFAANHHGNAWVPPALYLREEKPTRCEKYAGSVPLFRILIIMACLVASACSLSTPIERSALNEIAIVGGREEVRLAHRQYMRLRQGQVLVPVRVGGVEEFCTSAAHISTPRGFRTGCASGTRMAMVV